MDTRSLSFTLIQLLLRPGYLIHDYLSGKRQVSFPPVKMLFIVAIVNVLASRLHTMLYGSAEEPENFEGLLAFMNQFVTWAQGTRLGVRYSSWASLFPPRGCSSVGHRATPVTTCQKGFSFRCSWPPCSCSLTRLPS